MFSNRKEGQVIVAKMICTVGGPINIVRTLPKEATIPPPPLPPPSPPPPLAPNEPPVIGHCIFCLRRLIEPETEGPETETRKAKLEDENSNQLRLVPKAELEPELVLTFNKLLPCIHKKWRQQHSNRSNGLDLNNITGKKKTTSQESSYLPKDFPHLPAMCQFCGDRFQNLDRLINVLTAAIQELTKVITESKMGGEYSWRGKQFVEDVRNNSALTKKSVMATLEFIDGFGVVHETEETDAFWDDKVEVKTEADDLIDNENGEDFQTYRQEHFRSPDNPDNTLHATVTDPASTATEFQPSKRKKISNVRKIAKKRKKNIKRKPPKIKIILQNCDLCPVKLPSTEMLDHLTKHNISDYVCTCPNPDCNLVFSSPYKLEIHLFKHRMCRKLVMPLCKCTKWFCTCAHLRERFCESCDFKTRTITQLRAHLQSIHEVSPEKNFICPLDGCQKGFVVKQSVHCHIDSCHQFRQRKDDFYQKCTNCGIGDNGVKVKCDEMIQHLQTVHNCTEIHSCRSCSFHFSSWEKLLEHLRTHRLEPDCLTCYICNDGTQFPFYRTLLYHYYASHKVGTLKKCEECEKTFLDSRSMAAHKTMLHSNVFENNINRGKRKMNTEKSNFKRFVCLKEGCGKSFKQKSSLRSHHLLNHAGLSGGYKCDYEGCDKKYNYIFCLEQHKMVAHLGIRPEKVVCEECGEEFTCQKSLQRHKLVHTEERPYQCSYCGQRFRQTCVMKRHIQSHEERGDVFKPNGPMKKIRKRVQRKYRYKTGMNFVPIQSSS